MNQEVHFTLVVILLGSQLLSCKAQNGGVAGNRFHIFCNVALWYPETYKDNFGSSERAGWLHDPFLCTHIVFSFVHIIERSNKHGWTWELSFPEVGIHSEQQALREKLVRQITLRTRDVKKSTQFLFAVGGFSDFERLGGLEKYKRIATNANGALDKLLDGVVDLIRRYGAHGVDFTWYFLGKRGGQDAGMTAKYEDLQHLEKIATALCGRMKKEGFLCVLSLVKAEHPELSSSQEYVNALRRIIELADFVNIWTADILPPKLPNSMSWLLPHDLLISEKPGWENHKHQNYSVNSVVKFYEKVCGHQPRLWRKLSMVISLYSTTYGLDSKSISLTSLNVNTEAKLYPSSLPFHLVSPYPYFQVCKDLVNNYKHSGWKWEIANYEDDIPILFTGSLSGRKGVGIAIPTLSQEYMRRKVAFAKSKLFGGITVVHATGDDVFGWYHNMSYPMLNAITEELGSSRYL